MELTTEIVRELLDYDQETGIFVWKVRERKWFNREQDFKRWNARFAGGGCRYSEERRDRLCEFNNKCFWKASQGPQTSFYLDGRGFTRSGRSFKSEISR